MRSKILPCIAISAAVTFCLAAAVSARANVIFELGNHPQPGEQNIIFGTKESGTTISGFTNRSHTLVQFSSTTDVLVQPSSGQADVHAQDGAINDVTIMAPGFTFTDLIFNLQIGKLGPSTADVTVNLLNEPPAFFMYTLGPGQNFLTIVAQGGEAITSVTIDDSTGFLDLRQPRISGLAAIPEPATLALLGTGLLVINRKLGARKPLKKA